MKRRLLYTNINSVVRQTKHGDIIQLQQVYMQKPNENQFCLGIASIEFPKKKRGDKFYVNYTLHTVKKF